MNRILLLACAAASLPLVGCTSATKCSVLNRTEASLWVGVLDDPDTELTSPRMFTEANIAPHSRFDFSTTGHVGSPRWGLFVARTEDDSPVVIRFNRGEPIAVRVEDLDGQLTVYDAPQSH